jgi:hypothetical protein
MSAHPQDLKTDAGDNGTDVHVHDARQRSANEHPGTDAVNRFLLLGGTNITNEVLGDPDGSRRIGNDCSVFGLLFVLLGIWIPKSPEFVHLGWTSMIIYVYVGVSEI